MPIIDPFEQVKETTIVDPFLIKAEEPTDSGTGPEWSSPSGILGSYGPSAYGAYGAGKALLKSGAEMYAMSRGAKVGGKLSGGRLLGKLGGAGAGYMATEAVESKIKDPSEPLSYGDMAKDFGLGAGFEGVGLAANKILSPLGSRLSKYATDIQKKAREMFGIQLSPAEVTQNKTLALWESLMDKSPFSASEVSQWRELNQLKPMVNIREKLLSQGGNPSSINTLGSKIKSDVDKFLKTKGIETELELNTAREQVLRKLGSRESVEDLVTPVQELLGKKSAEAVAKKNEIYAEIGDLIPKGKAVSEEMGNLAESYLSKINKLPNQDKELTNVLSWASKKTTPTPEAMQVMKQVEAMKSGGASKTVLDSIIKQAKDEGIDFGGERISRDWESLQGLRIQLNDLIKKADLSVKMGRPDLKGQTSYEGSVYKALKQALDKDLESIAMKSGSGAYEKMQIANAFFKEEYAPLWKESKLIKQLAYKNPEEVVDVVFKPINIQEIRKLKEALGDGGFNGLQKAFTKKILKADADKTFDPQTLKRTLDKYGNEFMDEIYTPEQLTMLKGLANRQFDTQIVGGSFLKAVTESNPEIIADSILGTMQRTTSEKVLLNNLINIKKSVSPKVFDDLKYQFAERLFQPNQLTDLIGPETISRGISRYGNALSLLYSPSQVKWLHQIEQIGKRMVAAEKLAQNPSGTAQNIIAYGTLGAVVNPLIKGDFGQFISGIGSAVLTPKFMAKIYLSPTGRKYFTEGLVTKPTTKRGIEVIAKLLGILSQEDNE